MRDSAQVLLIPTRSRSPFGQRTRRGSFLLLGAILFVVTLVFYFCSLDYQHIDLERRLLQYHQLTAGAGASAAAAGALSRATSRSGSRVNVGAGSDLVRPELWNTKLDPDYRPSPSEQLVIQQSEASRKALKTRFDITGRDVIVFLHIQNTGGNIFGRHLVEDLLLDRPCNCQSKKKCTCWRPEKDNSYWLFSRWTVGWRCGVHPDWSQLTNCVDRALDELEGEANKRRYFYITLLRDPVTRFLSEYYRFRGSLGASGGQGGRHYCAGKEVQRMPKCSFTSSEPTIMEYLSCPHNLALDRQTRMLSDLALVGCYNSSKSVPEKDLILLSSAKSNLHKMAFFGLTEYPRISQKLFEETFDVMFLDADTHGFGRNKRSILADVPEETIEAIKKANHLDVRLYDYAKLLLFDRFDRLEKKYPRLEATKRGHGLKDDIVNWGEREDAVQGIK